MNLEVKEVDASSLKGHPKNPNKHSVEQVDRLAKLIQYQGIRLPVIVSNLSGFVVAGHGRLLAYEKLGIKKVPVSFQDFVDGAQEYAFMVSDNAIKDWSYLDLKMVNEDFTALGPDFDLEFLAIDRFGMDKGEDDETDKTKGKQTKFTVVECPECGHSFEPEQGE